LTELLSDRSFDTVWHKKTGRQGLSLKRTNLVLKAGSLNMKLVWPFIFLKK